MRGTQLDINTRCEAVTIRHATVLAATRISVLTINHDVVMRSRDGKKRRPLAKKVLVQRGHSYKGDQSTGSPSVPAGFGFSILKGQAHFFGAPRQEAALRLLIT